MKKILIIGSNSFSGSTFAKYCLSIGHEVHGVSRSIEPSKIFLPHYWSNPQANFKFLQLDLNFDQKKLIQLILDQDYSCIFNFAAQSMVGESWSNPKDWLKTNVLSVSELLTNLSKIKNIPRFVHVSTPEVYGSTSTWINEESPFNPSTPYAVSRSAGDMLFKIYAKNFGFVGSLILLFLWILFFYRVALIIKSTDLDFEKYALSGFVFLLSVQIIINLLTVLGLVPLTGMAFPLLSLGGSSILSTSIIFGLINRVFIENNVVL